MAKSTSESNPDFADDFPAKSRAVGDELRDGVVAIFVDLVRMLGMPPSVGAIYGLLFISHEPLCLDDCVARLGISKGSASQGLAILRRLGALRPAPMAARREYFTADTELKKLVGGFLRSEVLPQIARGTDAVNALLASGTLQADDVRGKFRRERLIKLANWQNRGAQVLGLLHRFLD